jgi:WD40 repeat protein
MWSASPVGRSLFMAVKIVNDFFVSGGTLPPGSASYINRGSDKVLLDALLAGRYCYVLNSRQMGKSSLSVRTMAELEAHGIRTAFVDLTQIGGRNVTPEQWYTGLCGELGRSLGLRKEVLAYCKENADLSPMQRLFGSLREVLLSRFDTPVVLFVDEIDATKNLSFNTDEFFAGIRECYNGRVRHPELQRLTFCLLGVAVPSDLISNPLTTPFNIGERIQLQDFTLDEMQRFAPALGSNGFKLVERVHYWTHGQPFLSQSLCQTIANEELKEVRQVDAVVFEQFFGPKARDTNINLADVANRALNAGALEQDPERFRADLLSAYERAWKGGNLKDDEANRVAVVLKLSGLMRTDGNTLKVRNPIYHHVFDQQWIRENMPEQELRRQEQSFRRGLIRGTLAAAAIIATVSILGAIAWQSRQSAVEAKSKLDYELYVADMSSMRFFEETGDIARMEQVLNRTKESPHRGFEWEFWNGRLHDADEEYTLGYTAPGKREDGLLSLNGFQICLIDSLLGTATVVERASKQMLRTTRTNPRTTVCSTSIGFLTVDSSQVPAEVRHLATGEIVSRIGDPTWTTQNVVTGRYCDFALVSASEQPGPRTWELWNMVTGQRLSQFPETTYRYERASLSSDGKKMFCVVIDTDRAMNFLVVDTHTGKTLANLPAAPRSTFYDYSTKGNLYVYRDPQFGLNIRSINGKVRHRWQLAPNEIPITVAIMPDERHLIGLYPNGRATVTTIADNRLVSSRNNVWTVSASPDGANLIAGSSSVRILPFDESAGARIIGNAYRIARDGRGQIRATSDAPVRIRVFSDPGLKFLKAITGPPEAYSPTYNGNFVANPLDGGKSSAVWSLDAQSPVFTRPGRISNFSTGAKGETVAIVTDGIDTMSGVDGKSGKTMWSLHIASGVRGMWLSPDEKLLIAMMTETEFMAFDARTGRLLRKVDAHNVRITNITFPNDQVFFTCGADGRAILWSRPTFQKIQEFKGNAVQRISGADISPDGTRVATCSYAGSWQLWDAKTGTQLMELQASTFSLRSIVFSADGRKVLTSGEDQQIKVWTCLRADPATRIRIPHEFARGIKP